MIIRMRKIALEFKYRETRLSRPDVDTIVGNAIRNGVVTVGNLKSGCVVIKCHTAASTAFKAAQEWQDKGVEVIIDPCLSSYDEQYKGGNV